MGPTVTSIRGQSGNQTDRLPAAGVGTAKRQKGWLGGNGKVKVDKWCSAESYCGMPDFFGAKLYSS